MTPISTLHDPTIYDQYERLGLALDVRGWHSQMPAFARLISETRPSVIVEVGSFRGASAIHMARISAGPAAPHIFCIDTWLGSGDMTLHPETPGFDMVRERGFPRVYFQFLHNVAASGFSDRITPVPLPSVDGARWLRHHDISPGLIYVDGSHYKEDVAVDLGAYWPLLGAGGIMFGDDWHGIRAVREAVSEFAQARGLTVEIDTGNHWIFRR